MKKKIPLIVLEKINPILKSNKDLYIMLADPDCSFSLVDADAESDFSSNCLYKTQMVIF